MEKPYVVISGMFGGEGIMDKKAISIREKVRNIGAEKQLEVFGQNPSWQKSIRRKKAAWHWSISGI